MNRFVQRLRGFFFPPQDSPTWVRVLPYVVLGILTLFLLTAGAYAWDYTNSPAFCGTTCHTMPPEFTSYLTSPHARVDCVECHIGRGFIATRITRKAGDLRHVFATAFKTYEFPITADALRPARETCERCHFPEKFSDDSLRQIKKFTPDLENSPYSLYLVLKTGGGSERLGLGKGIHWHIENQIYYLPTDQREQTIPFVRVVEDDGSATDYVDIESDIDPENINEDNLKEMDCITCHNRITHLILPPDDTVNQLLDRGLISRDIPEIREKAVEVYSQLYDTTEKGLRGIEGLSAYYQTYYPDFYAENDYLVQQAIEVLKDSYGQSVFPEQKSDWTSHPKNVGHKDSPGCFRCHDGKHLNVDEEAIRLECNLCHSIPIVAGPEDFVADIEISRGPEPSSHRNPNWITLHHSAFDDTCANCHTTENPGGTTNTSFCSNSACHGNVWEYAGFDAPGLRERLISQLPPTPTPMPAPVGGALTYVDTIGSLFEARCGACHGATDSIQDLNLTSYQGVLDGGTSGPAIVPGDPDSSLLVQKQTADTPHFGQLSPQELELVIDWIEAGAPEN
jgi:nitrate/TMAO reductase-like tetraheme cytochrome c subunit